ncbi:putative beta-xylosidase [Candidatus Sulfotelmatomonas gaucii]|uniref:Putative beta-xylosidase n=1 Tax=Candidatus Sulfuritelmatomonas gaucii TaxID=2043161 RepID=A0A2N9LUF2_9BACT|nr:putative beta-xylosidase [Candidatus Sulfotelmatomonas gaucii]
MITAARSGPLSRLRTLLPLICLCALGSRTPSQAAHATAEVMYHNPILFADYSDPDVIREGANYYLIASTFHFVPGIPILQSTDLVHWTIEGHVVKRLNMDPRYSMIGGNRYGKGVWAPAIRKHDGLFYVYFPTPSEGIFVSTAPKITGPWSTPEVVMAQAGLEDPCPFWDDDGKAYLIHSRTGAGPLILHRMSPDGKHVLDNGNVIVNDPVHLPVLEGPKLYKRGGYYYIFAPIGGVSGGSQVVLRSRQIYGPYDYRVVLAQGSTGINGPHQGAYVETPNRDGWFVHFQSDGAHGRIVHLEPVHWQDDWPEIGADPDDVPIGQPIPSGPIPGDPRVPSRQHPQTSDDFGSPRLAPQWEWNHNPDDAHWSLSARPGYLRLIPMQADGILSARDTLTECMQDNAFEFTVRLDLAKMKQGVHAGLAMFEQSASGLEVAQSGRERRLSFFHLSDRVAGPLVAQNIVELRVNINGDEARYSYSLDDGKTFHALGAETPIRFSWWKGSRPALFAYTTESSDPGAVDFDWAHYQPEGENPW